jgi:hypothetical protein
MTVIKQYNAGVWETVVVGKQGPTGAQGATGPQGATGATGPAGPLAVINTDGDPGGTIYVGSVDPDVSYTPAVGDVWIQLP